MNRARGRCAELARLQGLAELERRRDAAAARALSDHCDASMPVLAERMDDAAQDHREALSDARFSLSRWTIAASLLTASEEALRDGRTALLAARLREESAVVAWRQSRHRKDWFAECDRDERRRDERRSADRADADARTLRLGRCGDL